MTSQIETQSDPEAATFAVETVDGPAVFRGVRYINVADNGALWLMGAGRSIIKLYAHQVWTSLSPLDSEARVG